MLRILITEPENFSKKAEEILRDVGKLEKFTGNRKKLLKIVRNFDILFVGLKFKIDKEIINRAKSLKIIACPATGLDHIDLDLAKKKKIEVISLRDEPKFLKEVWATAEHTFALIFSLIRKIPPAFYSVKKGKWQREKFIGTELRGKILGIIGFGRLGSMVCRIAKCFGMKILAYDPYVPKNKIKKLGALSVRLSDLLKNSDIVTVHVSLTRETKRLIGEKEFKKMKNSALFINTSRGEVIDEKALLRALKRKKIAGAAIDVMKGESFSGKFLRKNPLISYAKKNQNLIITPHLGGATRESMQKTQIFIAKKIQKLLN